MVTEFVVFLPKTNTQEPLPLARELIASLPAGRADLGVDLLTGGVEIRFYFDAVVLTLTRNWLQERNLVFDIHLQ